MWSCINRGSGYKDKRNFGPHTYIHVHTRTHFLLFFFLSLASYYHPYFQCTSTYLVDYYQQRQQLTKTLDHIQCCIILLPTIGQRSDLWLKHHHLHKMNYSNKQPPNKKHPPLCPLQVCQQKSHDLLRGSHSRQRDHVQPIGTVPSNLGPLVRIMFLFQVWWKKKRIHRLLHYNITITHLCHHHSIFPQHLVYSNVIFFCINFLSNLLYLMQSHDKHTQKENKNTILDPMFFLPASNYHELH